MLRIDGARGSWGDRSLVVLHQRRQASVRDIGASEALKIVQYEYIRCKAVTRNNNIFPATFLTAQLLEEPEVIHGFAKVGVVCRPDFLGKD